MRASESLITIYGTYLGESAKAVKFQVEEINGSVLDKEKVEWFPFSQIKSILKASHCIDNTESDKLVVSRWIMQQKGYDV